MNSKNILKFKIINYNLNALKSCLIYSTVAFYCYNLIKTLLIHESVK